MTRSDSGLKEALTIEIKEGHEIFKKDEKINLPSSKIQVIEGLFLGLNGFNTYFPLFGEVTYDQDKWEITRILGFW